MGIDWEPSLRFASATAELGAPVYYAISFMDPVLAGTVTITGTTADAAYAPTSPQITAFAAGGLDPLVTHWEKFFNITTPYPSTTLTYQTTNAQYASSLVTALTSIQATLTGGSSTSIFDFSNHTTNTNNPHVVTPTQLSLDAVPNWTTGTVADVVAANASAFVTPAAAAGAVGSVIAQATPTVPGYFKLNQGGIAGDDSNALKALTAAGLVALITSGTANAVNAYFNKPRQAVQFSPFPITYPARWRSVDYSRFTDLVAAVSAYTNISPLMYSDALGTIWFPNSVTPPSLVLG
jgi:hypothetical protein